MLYLRALFLFSGIGGLDLAAEAAGFQTVAFCEINEYCRKVLAKHWPGVPVYNDVYKLRGDLVGAVELIHGGFPCQPFSLAGKMQGRNDDRYLWPEFARLVGEIRPRWVVAENVPGIFRKDVADDVCKDMEREGYKVGIWCYEAAAVGAPHRRARVFFVCHADESRRRRNKRRQDAQEPADGREAAADNDGERRQEQRQYFAVQAGLSSAGCRGWWSAEPDVGRVAYGIPTRVDRLRALGNAVVPAQAYPIFKAIAEIERGGEDAVGH